MMGSSKKKVLNRIAENDKAEDDVGGRTRQSNQGGIPLGILEIERVKLNRFGPAERDDRYAESPEQGEAQEHGSADPVVMPEGIEREPALHAGGRIAELVGGQGVGELMDGDGNSHGERSK
jgi:hypothetical protein